MKINHLLVKSIFCAAMTLATTIAMADYGYLYWAIDTSNSENPLAFTYAQIKAIADGGETTLADSRVRVAGAEAQEAAGPFNTALTENELPKGLEAYQFVVELLNSSKDPVGETLYIAYSELADHIFTDMNPGDATAMTFDSFQSVPEPTSAMMLLVGLAGLALRRRRS